MGRRLHLQFFAAAAILVAAAACEKVDNETIPVLTMPKALFTSEGEVQQISIAATSTWTLSVDYPAGQAQDWIHFSKVSGEGFDNTVQMTVDPNTGSDSRQATVWLRGPKYSTSASVSQSSDASGGSPLWLELPALDDSGCGFFTHSMDGGLYISANTSGVRNWSFYWDYENHLSHWVAYPLNKGLIGKGGRSNEWGFDPLLPAEIQPDVHSTYGGGWTRGHQIPSADRLSYAANVSTFYGTNMTPQDYDFNTFIWADLEGKVRDYASTSDTLYVVTGCDIRGFTASSGWNTGFSVPVPVAYYKALLRKKGSAYAAVGYYLPHDRLIADGDYRDYLLSIDQLEEKTGVDFFVNLRTMLGAAEADAIEAADPKVTVKNW